MNNRFKAIAAGIMLTGALSVTNQAHALMIDDFNYTAHSLISLGGAVSGAQTAATGAIGGYRKFDILSATGFMGMTANMTPTSGAFSLSNGSLVSSVVSVLWNANGAGLGGVDLTDGGLSSNLQLAITAIDLVAVNQGDVTITFDITELGSVGGTTATLALPGLGLGLGLGPQIFSFNSFTNFAAVDFTKVDAIKMTVSAGDSFDLTLDFVNTIPEPSSIALMGIGLVGFSAFRKRKSA